VLRAWWAIEGGDTMVEGHHSFIASPLPSFLFF
jgi:hypothetical protein